MMAENKQPTIMTATTETTITITTTTMLQHWTYRDCCSLLQSHRRAEIRKQGLLW